MRIDTDIYVILHVVSMDPQFVSGKTSVFPGIDLFFCNPVEVDPLHAVAKWFACDVFVDCSGCAEVQPVGGIFNDTKKEARTIVTIPNPWFRKDRARE